MTSPNGISHNPSTASSRPDFEHTNEPKPAIEYEMSSVGTRNNLGGDASTLNSSNRDGVVYAEYDPEVGPQVVIRIPDDPEPVVIPRTPTPEPEVFFVPATDDSKFSKAWSWVKNKPWLAAAVGSGIIGALLLLVLCPVLIRNFSGQNGSSVSLPATPTNGSSSSTTSTASASATPSRGSPDKPIAAKCNDSLFTHGIDWMGISDPKGDAPWRSLPAADTIDCCSQCWIETDEGCQGWWMNPSPNNKVPCTILYGYEGNMVDDTCSKGHAFLAVNEKPGSIGVGAAGPCGTLM